MLALSYDLFSSRLVSTLMSSAANCLPARDTIQARRATAFFATFPLATVEDRLEEVVHVRTQNRRAHALNRTREDGEVVGTVARLFGFGRRRKPSE